MHDPLTQNAQHDETNHERPNLVSAYALHKLVLVPLEWKRFTATFSWYSLNNNKDDYGSLPVKHLPQLEVISMR